MMKKEEWEFLARIVQNDDGMPVSPINKAGKQRVLNALADAGYITIYPFSGGFLVYPTEAGREALAGNTPPPKTDTGNNLNEDHWWVLEGIAKGDPWHTHEYVGGERPFTTDDFVQEQRRGDLLKSGYVVVTQSVYIDWGFFDVYDVTEAGRDALEKHSQGE